MALLSASRMAQVCDFRVIQQKRALFFPFATSRSPSERRLRIRSPVYHWGDHLRIHLTPPSAYMNSAEHAQRAPHELNVMSHWIWQCVPAIMGGRTCHSEFGMGLQCCPQFGALKPYANSDEHWLRPDVHCTRGSTAAMDANECTRYHISHSRAERMWRRELMKT